MTGMSNNQNICTRVLPPYFILPPHCAALPTDFGQTLPQQAGRAADCQGPHATFNPHSRALSVGCNAIQPRMGSKTISCFSPAFGGPPKKPAVLNCVAKTGVVSADGGNQAPRYHPLSLR